MTRPTPHPSPPGTPVRGLELRYGLLTVLHRRRGAALTIDEMVHDLADLGVRPAPTGGDARRQE